MKTWNNKQTTSTKHCPNAFWLYEDGQSFWGEKLYRFGKLPVEITSQEHAFPQKEKLKLYAQKTQPTDESE